MENYPVIPIVPKKDMIPYITRMMLPAAGNTTVAATM
jgi:hypothetical protein